MFSKSSKSPSSASPTSPPKSATGAKNTPFSIIGGDVSITGNISASVDLHIDGRIEGDISCAALVQGPDSKIKGHVTAQTARLAGLVEGSITAGELIIESSARITGDVSYDSITIATGGKVEGRFAHKDGAQTGELKLIAG
ncbi:MAG: polymer-forming cytoskeletal protein [Sphingobium sp.]